MKKVVFAYGRFNPPTIGHEQLMNVARDAAKKDKDGQYNASFTAHMDLTDGWNGTGGFEYGLNQKVENVPVGLDQSSSN